MGTRWGIDEEEPMGWKQWLIVIGLCCGVAALVVSVVVWLR